MGYRLHVCKKYDVQYANIEDFNWKAAEIEELFCLLAPDDYNGPYEDSGFDIDKGVFDEMLNVLVNYPDDNDRPQVFELCKKLGYPNPTDLAKRLKEFSDAADPNNDYVHFEFF